MDDLAAALRELVESHPAEDPAQTVDAMVLADPTASRTIALQPRHVVWLTDLIHDELLTYREAHNGGTGECGHCGHVAQFGDFAYSLGMPD